MTVKKPLVKTKRRMRKAKGFSLGELKEAGLTELQARRLKIPVDPRRKTVHPQNVASLRDASEKGA